VKPSEGNRNSIGSDRGYEPTRTARLRDRDTDPPPIPLQTATADRFGSEDEDGLRMLAALETLTSLEPDYFDDLASEASVTIIDAAGHELVSDAFDGYVVPRSVRSLRETANFREEPGLLLNGYETFLGPGDEAIVEIVQIEPTTDFEEEAPDKSIADQPTSLTQRLAAAVGPSGRFLKALSGD
jgi:hypothetical protein